MSLRHENLFIQGPAGKIEALLWAPAAPARPPMACVFCHPHPVYGGRMHNKVVYQAAKTLHEYGLAVLRFNFRGVGQSEGAYDHGRGEAEDVRGALDWLASEFPRTPLLAGGFSFGAWTGMRVGCQDDRVVELIGLGLPVNDRALDFDYLQNCSKPKLLLIGDNDQFADRTRVEALVRSFAAASQQTTTLEFVAGADHFFTGQLEDMRKSIAAWITGRHPQLRESRLET